MHPLEDMLFSVDSQWFKGQCNIITFSLEELIASKLKALFQRRKGRDILLPELENWNFEEAFDFVQKHIVQRIP